MAEAAVATQLAYRTPRGVGLLNTNPTYEKLPGFIPPPETDNIRCNKYSPNGLAFAWANPKAVTVNDADSGAVVNVLPVDNVFELEFSPLGTYLVTWQRPSKDETGNATKNLKIWRTAEAGDDQQPIWSYVQKAQTGWNLQWTADGDAVADRDLERDSDGTCARMVTNEVHYLKVDTETTVIEKLQVEGLSEFSLCGTASSPIAVFVPGKQGQQSTVKVFGPVYRPPHNKSVENSKSFWNADKIQFKWDRKGAHLIVLAQTDVDKSNKSYYGNTFLYVLDRTGKVNEHVVLDKEGPIHDIAWNPTADPSEFTVTYGFMPAKTTIFNSRGKAKYSFDMGMRNTVAYSPHGRYLLVAGFGNLNGQMDIYDLEHNYTKITTIDAPNSSVCEWSPDGRHIMTATTSPRLRVDNGVRIWHISGKLMFNQDMNELYSVAWRPQSLSRHPLGSSPVRNVPTPHHSAAEYLAQRKTPAKPAGAYRPPGARGTSTPLHFKREDEGGASFSSSGLGTSALVGANGFGAGRRRVVPGAESASPPKSGGNDGGVSLAGYENYTGAPPGSASSKSAAKNKKKRESKKAKENEEKGGQGSTEGLTAERGTGTNGSRSYSRSPSRRDGYNDRSRSRGPGNSSRHERHGSRATSRGRGPGGGGGLGGGGMANATVNGGKPSTGKAPAGLSGLDTRFTSGPSLNVTLPTPISANAPTRASSGNQMDDAQKSEHEKKIRSLHKKLRAIEELKMRQATGEKLEVTQLKKIEGENEVRGQLDALGSIA